MSNGGESSADEFQKHELSKKLVRKTYLITYSRANESICLGRETFSRLILESFQKSKSSAKVLQWAVCREPHKNKGINYHMWIKFDHNQRWRCSEQHLLAAHKVSVRFSENHANYIAAYRYVCKSNRNVLLSPGNPDLDLTVSPRTNPASKELQRWRRSSTNEKSTEPPQKTKRYSKAEVMDIIKDKSIKNETELLALAAT